MYKQGKVYKYLLISLAIIIASHSALTSPGFASLEIFNHFIKNVARYFLKLDAGVFFRYPPLIFLILKTLLDTVPQITTEFFYQQPVWMVYKVILLINYFATYLGIYFFCKTLRKRAGTTIDVAMGYFLSFSITLSITFLSFFELLAAPFLLFALAFLNQKRIASGSILFLIALLCNPYLAVFAPFLYLTFKDNSAGKGDKTVFNFSLAITPLIIAITYLFLLVSQKQFLFETPVQTLGIPWLFATVLKTLNEFVKGSASLLKTVTCLVALIPVAYFFLQTLSKTILKLDRFWAKILLTLGLGLCFLTLFLPSGGFFFFHLFFLTFYGIGLLTYKSLPVKKRNLSNLFQNLSSLTFIILFFLPEISPGNLAWLTIFALLSLQISGRSVNRIKLILTNVLVFALLFVLFGINGRTPEIDPEYLSIFKIILSTIFISFGLWNFKNSLKVQISQPASVFKKILMGITILFYLTFILSQGTVDVTIYHDMNKILVEHTNPFTAHPLIGNQYPPLSTVVYFILSHAWKALIGFQGRFNSSAIGEYALPTKISGAVVYFLFLIILTKFAKKFGVNKSLKKIDLFLISLTTFSLALQSISLGDLDIYIAIPMFFAILLFFRKFYFLSGISLGLAAALKWQPMLLIPVFIATIFTLKKDAIKNIKRLVLFSLGAVLVISVPWIPILLGPSGRQIFERDFVGFFLGSPPYLSGQALNLDWIATYFLHLLNPARYEGLNRGLNWVIGTGSAPKIFQGYFFYAASAVILPIYWLSYKKRLPHFLSVVMMLFFTHHMLNKGAYENHFFYPVLFMLLLFLVKPTKSNRQLLSLLDLMSFINQALFYGLTGAANFKTLIFGFDTTIFYSAFYLFIYGIILYRYFQLKGAFE